MPRRALLAKINEAWKTRDAGWKYAAMVNPVGVQERQLAKYLDPQWVQQRTEFLDLDFNQWAELTPSLQKAHPRFGQYSQQQRGLGRLNPVQQQALLEKITGHLGTLKRTVHEDLLDLHLFPPDARPIRQWFASPRESSCPVSLGHAHRQGSGMVQVTLDLQQTPGWEPVRLHLTGHAVLAALEEWRRATAADLAARLALLGALAGYAHRQTSLPVRPSVNDGDLRDEGLHNHYLDLLYEQVFRTVINQGPPLAAPVGRPLPLTREEFSRNQEGDLCHYHSLVIRGGAEAQQENALLLLLEAPDRLSDMPQAVAAAREYRAADAQTSHLRDLRSQVLSSGLDPDSRCEICQPWFQALGVPGQGLTG